MNDIIASRADYPRFRILIVGRTNAGKTTLVKRICNSSENPQVLTARGAMVFLGLLQMFGIA
jgi:GTPase SAR1 family protein